MLQPSCIDDDDDPPSHNVGGPTPDGESTESVAASTNSTLPASVVVHQQQRTTADDDSSSSGAVDMVCGSQASAAVTAAETAGEATGQHYCLRWNNYQSNMTSVFHHLLRTQAFVDVTLACDDQSLKAHKGIEGHPVDIAEEAGDGKDRLAPQLVVVDPQGRLAEAIVLTTASSAQSAAPHHHIQQPSQAQAHTTAAQSTSKSEHHDSSSRLATEEQLISVERQNGVVIDPLDAPTSEPPAPSATLVSTQIELPQPESTTRRDIAIDSSDLSIEENGGVKVKFETLRAMEHHHHMDMEAAARMSDEGDHHGMHTMMITPELLGLIPSSNSESSETDSKSHSNSSTMASSSMTPGVGGKTWSSEDMDAALEALRKQTMSLSKASALYGIPSTTLWQRAHRLGIDTPKKEGPTKSWTEDNLNTALDALRTGTLSANKASKAFGIPSSTLYKIARREGIRLAAPFNAAPTSWVPEDLERALESIRSGQYTVQRAATEYGIPSGTLYGRCKREGIELSRNNPTPWSEDAMMEALEAVRLGHMSINQAAIHYNLPYSSLYGRFKRVKFDPDGVPTGGMHGDSEGSTGDVITGPQPPQAQPAPSGQSQSQQQATTSAPSQQPSHQTTPQIMLVQYQQPLHMYQSAT